MPSQSCVQTAKIVETFPAALWHRYAWVGDREAASALYSSGYTLHIIFLRQKEQDGGIPHRPDPYRPL